MQQVISQLEVKILCDDSTGFDEVGHYFATEADKMIDIVYDFDEDKLRILERLLNCIV